MVILHRLSDSMASCDSSDGISSISGETLEKAERELGEVPEKRTEAIQELREKIEQWRPDPHEEEVTFSRKDNQFLLRFLRARKFDSSRALRLYINYHKYRQKYAHLLEDYHPAAVEQVLKSGLFRVPSSRGRNGEKLVCLFPRQWDLENTPFNDIFKALLLILDKLIEDEETQVHGFRFIDNIEGATLRHALKAARTEQVRKGMLVEMIQEAFPARFKGLHLINQPWYVSIILTIVRPFMKQKLRERLLLHGTDFESLHEFIDPEDLPVVFGEPQPGVDPHGTLTLFEMELSK